jgi:hypothetical protein
MRERQRERAREREREVRIKLKIVNEIIYFAKQKQMTQVQLGE